MPSGTNYNAFCANYSTIANCLFAIQAAEENGSLNSHPELIQQLYVFDWGVLRKLYNRTIIILGTLQGNTPGGNLFDFSAIDFSAIDFNAGITDNSDPEYGPAVETISPGDFSAYDFSGLDYNVGFLDETNNSYSSHFQTILNMFGELCRRSSELSDTDRQNLNLALVPVLNEYTRIQNSLIAIGLNPCVPDIPYFNNSPSLYLQASGADGNNGIAAGIHLRWSLADDLGTNHLPQGDYYAASATTSGYNRPNDYITLSRTLYTNPVVFILDFESAMPAIDFANKQWSYTINMAVGNRQISNVALLTFKDADQYNQLAASNNPLANSFAFLQLYNGLLELEIKNKTAFAISYDFRPRSGQTNPYLKIEALSASNINGVPTETINIRKTISTGAGLTGKIVGDNMIRFRLQKSANGYLQSLSFETYDDFISSRQAADWTVIGSDFALSLTDQTVFDWLETADYPIDNLWPQYNDGTRVKIANYHDKWSTTRANDPSVKETVQKYLELSETDPRAEDVIKDDDAAPDDPGLLVSYLDIINLMALDYHLARMLGLGYIDAQVNSLESAQFIYKISYKNLKNADSQQVITHEYASLPTGRSESRLPPKPTMRPLSYNLPIGNNETLSAFDSNGYINNANIRLVNIGRQPYNFESLTGSFFESSSDDQDFNIFSDTRSILYGIEYRPADQDNYVKPEITGDKSLGHIYYAYDSDFPTTGVPETTPAPDNATSLYVHFEKQEGIHHYAVYGINWFSRASTLSEEAATDATTFPVRNTLQPPSDVTVQYIQQEDTLLFTTATEQGWLSGRSAQFPGQDINLTRLTFNWLDITDISYVQDITTFDYSKMLKPTRVKPWFKPALPLQVTGVVTGVFPIEGTDRLLLNTGSYALLDGTLVSPAIASTDLPRFTGSLLTMPEGQFLVQSVALGVDGPAFTVKKIVQTINVEDPAEPNLYSTRNTYILPVAGNRFTVTENLSEEVNWLPVAQDVVLLDFSDPASPITETFVDDEGNITRYLVGGISGSAVITQLHSTVDQTIMPGYYLVAYNAGVGLAPHPQAGLPFDPANPAANAPGALHAPDVEWYNGLIRIPVAESPANKKLLQVIRIIQTNPLQVYVYDGAYQDDTIRVSASETDFVDMVNFHPGYKTYLFSEPLPDHNLNGSNILPAAGANDKKTLIGLQATDTGTGGSGYVSRVSLPVILLSRRVDVPVRPGLPLYFGLKVRPDAINKAAFTLDLKIAPDTSGAARSPFGVAFYRTSNEDVLHALYNPDTVTTILAALEVLTVDDNFDQRYDELVNLFFDPDSPGNFRVFNATPNAYGFPVPDKTGLTNPADSLDIKAVKYSNAIIMTLLPLTAQVPIFSFIKTGKQTDKKQPVIRTADGNLIDPTDPSFDPFPMITKYTNPAEANTTYVRFTDYTLNGSSRFLYFYGAAEVTNQLVTGELSPFAGPVSILHTLPPETPTIRFFTLTPPGDDSTSPIVVNFSLAPFLLGDTVNKVRVYRSLSQEDTYSLQSMTSSADFEIVMDVQYGIVITDSFADLPAVPAGETIYYRLAFIRTINNERDELEDITGQGSDVIIINLIDTINPDAPEITYTESENKLSWLATTNKGTYYLYTQNSRGNWQMIYQVKPTSAIDTMSYVFPAPLVLTDEDGNRIYYRYKVNVQNSSGLLNLVENELTI